jgi:chemotaxis protein MotB
VVLGLASSQPFTRQDPADPQNRRISIIVMNREAEDRFFGKLIDEQDLAISESPNAADSSSTSAPAVR